MIYVHCQHCVTMIISIMYVFLQSLPRIYSVTHFLLEADKMSHTTAVPNLLEIVGSNGSVWKPNIHILLTAVVCPKCVS